MSSLAQCLRKMGKMMSPVEAQALRSAADEYLTEGFNGEEASMQAVEDVLRELDGDLESILQQTPAPVAPPKVAPLPYGAVIQGEPSLDFRGWTIPVRPAQWEKLIGDNLNHPDAAKGDKEGKRSLTRVGLVLQEPDGKGVVLVGIVTPQNGVEPVTGTAKIKGPALQRMGSGPKKRVIAVGGDQPVAVRDVTTSGFKPLAIIHFTGEPARIFERFADLAAFDAVFAATDKVKKAYIGDKVPSKLQKEDRRALKTEAEIYAEIERIGAELKAPGLTDAQRDVLSKQAVQAIQEQYDLLDGVVRRGQSQTGDKSLDSARGSSFGPKHQVDPTAPNAFRFRNALPNELSQSDQDALAYANGFFVNKLGRPVKFTTVEPNTERTYRGPRGSIPLSTPLHTDGSPLAKLRVALERVFGKRVLFFVADIPIGSNALTPLAHPNYILVNAAAPNTFSALFGHELGHDLKNQRPELYQTLSDLILGVAPMPQRYATERKNLGYKEEDWTTEYVNDVIGDRFSENEFWDALGREARSKGLADKFRQLLDWVKQWLGLRSPNPDLRGDMSLDTRADMLPEINQIREAVAQAVIEFTQNTQRDVAFQTRGEQIKTPTFKTWFGKSRAVDAQGKPRVLYHGTKNDFTEFDPARVDSHALYGPGFYLTASKDVSGGDGSYAFKGAYQPDSVIDEIRASSVEDARKQFFADPSNSEYLGDDAEELAFIPDSDGIVTVINASEMEGTPNVLPLYAKIEQPFLVDEVPSDWRPIFNRLIAAAVSIGIDRGSFDNSVEFLEDANFNPSLRDLFRGLRFAQDEDGRNLGKEKAVRILKAAGYDGIMHTGGLSSKYGGGRPHDVVIVFDPSQVKSATGNSGAFDPANRDIRFQAVPRPPQNDPSLIAIEATRATQFAAVLDRLRRQGAKVDVFTQEFFRLGVRTEVEAQLAQLQQREAAATTEAQRREIAREIARRQERLAEIDLARGATFSPWHIALSVDDIQNATMGNLVTLLHEATEALAMRLTPMMRGSVDRAIQASLTKLRARRSEAAARTGVAPANETGSFDLLSETLAQELAAEGVPESPSLARAILNWIKDLYYRAAMAAQAAFGATPSDELALDWFENQLSRAVGGDYDFRIARLLDRYLPEPMNERIRRFSQPTGTPAGMTDYWNPYAKTIQQPSVLPDTSEAAEWNLAFQTGPAENAMFSPESYPRIQGAGWNKYVEYLEGIRAAARVDTPWAEWWKVFNADDDPRVLLAELAQKLPGAETAKIGGERMTPEMSGLAALEARRLMENFQVKLGALLASSKEIIKSEADAVIEASQEVNRIEADRRNAELQEGVLQKKLKDLVRRFVKDNSTGYRLAEQSGALAEAVREAEGLIDSDPIPEQYQEIFKSVMDGRLNVFDYVRAIARLDLPLSDMTQAEVIKAIRDNAESNETLKALGKNRPLMTALAVLARKNAGLVDEIHLGWIGDQQEYNRIHTELQAIRSASDAQLKDMLATADKRVKAVGLRERMKSDYLRRRRELQQARDRVNVAATRDAAIEPLVGPLAEAVERAQAQGSEAPSEWVPVEGAALTEMRPTEAGWSKRTRVLRVNPDGRFADGDALKESIALNKQWLATHLNKRGSKLWEEVSRQTHELGAIDISAVYATAQGRRMDKFLAPLMSEARNLGGVGSQVAQRMAYFEHVRFTNKDQVNINSHEWSKAWRDVQKSTGISDNGLFQRQIYDPVSYMLNTEPGLDEVVAIREATRMARARLTKPPAENFNVVFERLLRTTKKGFEHLVAVAEKSGAFVHDAKLKSDFRRAVARGWLTSMRSVDGGLVQRITQDMTKTGWKLAYEMVRDSRGRDRVKTIKAVTFRDLDADIVADGNALDTVLSGLFTPGIIRDWLTPFINKGGSEVFQFGGNAIPQLALQNAWVQADRNVLRWIDLVGESLELTPEENEDGAMSDPVADFRLSMLRQLDALYAMEAKMAYDASQTRDMFDPYGPQPHVVMDARIDDTVPPEHLNFALLDEQSSGLLLAEIAFHAAFGRNGERMATLLREMRQKPDAAKVAYQGLQQTTPNGRVAEAAALGWKNYGELERAARVSDDIQAFQDKLEAFMGTNKAGGPFDGTSRVWMSLLNFMAGQIVDNPKRAFYDILNLGQTPFAQRSLGPETIRTVGDAFVSAAKQGMGSLLEAMHLHLFHASAEELAIGQTVGSGRNVPWSTALSDIGPGGRQGVKEMLIRPLSVMRYVQNKGAGLPLQGTPKEFPRLALLPGLGVSNAISQITAPAGMGAISRQLERMVANGLNYLATHRDAVSDPSFRFKARDLGLGRWDQGVFDWWRVKTVENNMGTLEDIVRGAMPARAKGEQLLTRNQVLLVAQATATELNGDSSINTLPSLLVTHPFLRTVFPLLRWPFWATHKTWENLGSVDGHRDWRTYAQGVAILAAWNLPIGLAFTFLLDEYDDKLLGKKSNLPAVGGLAALPIVGPLADMLTADRDVPDTLKAYAVRGARAGNLGGIAADFIGQTLNPTDAQSGRRSISLDQRVLVMSQLLNLQQAASNVMNQGWTTTWASFWHPLFRSLGGSGALQMLDVANNALGLDNAESRSVARINSANWLRASAAELKIELRPGGSGTPTPMSVHTRSMFDAAMANDRIGFMEAYRKALEAARKNVSSDPSIPALDREREAERRVLSGWRGRDPLSIFGRRPTEPEVRRLLSIMDEGGQEAVRASLNHFNEFSRLIRVSPEQQKERALERRLSRPPLPNGFRRPTLAPVY